MVQTSYEQNMSEAIPGGKVDARFDDVVSRAAREVMPFAVITDDGGTWTAGNVVVTINGTVVTVAFDTDKATSMAAIATALQALAFITSATYAGGSDTITVVAAADVALNISSIDVTGITGNMTISSTVYSMSDSIRGLSIAQAKEPGSSRVDVTDRLLFTLSGDALNTSDTVDAVFNDIAMAQVTYATDEATTLQLVADALKAINGIASAVVSGRTITISNEPGLPLAGFFTVTDNALASVAPTFDSGVGSSQDVGISKQTIAYAPTETVSLVRKGAVYMRAEEAIARTDSLFVRVLASANGTQRGALRNDNDSGTAVAATGLVVLDASTTAPDGTIIVPVELNLP
jgi:cell division protein ZapA (FtsZ GTPase activity inhibitor)